MKRYPEYQDSGIEWVEEIPRHWKIARIKHAATLVTEKSTPEPDAIKISPENVESKTGKILDWSSAYDSIGVNFQAGDVLFNKLRVYLSKVVFAERSGYSLGEMIVIRPSLQNAGNYIFYLMLSCRFIEHCNSISFGVRMPRTSVDDILNAKIPLPSYQEQTQIANFLDHKTAQIDELIRAKERKLELLGEYRASLINQAVTKGLDPNVEMKPSGVEWIGDIPKHWKMLKIKHIVTLITKKSTPHSDAIKISPENVESKTGKILDLSSAHESIGVKFQAGDVLFNKLRVYLSKVVFAEWGGYSLGEMIVLRPFVEDTGKYLFYLMLSSRFIEYCNSISFGVKMPRTSVDDILNSKVPLATYQEQAQIADFLDRKTKQIDELRSSEEGTIKLLKEYRQSLISEVVTGKIDVRREA